MPKPRDEELDELEKELRTKEAPHSGTPFIERPPEMDVGPGTLCWADGTRLCGPDCVAYNTQGETEEGEVVQGDLQCLILGHMKKQAATTQALFVVRKKAEADAQRDAHIAAAARGDKL